MTGYLSRFLFVAVLLAAAPAVSSEVPWFEDRVASGEIPPVNERLPDEPLVIDDGREIGDYGGDWNMLIGRSKDTRLLVVFGYARLVGYDENFIIVPDILKSFTVEDGRIFTFHLRKGHRCPTAVPSRPRIFSTGGRTSPATRASRPPALPRSCVWTASRRSSR